MSGWEGGVRQGRNRDPQREQLRGTAGWSHTQAQRELPRVESVLNMDNGDGATFAERL